jgi:hypothetical protein
MLHKVREVGGKVHKQWLSFSANLESFIENGSVYRGLAECPSTPFNQIIETKILQGSY